jgi:hypothetical protein
VELGVASGGVVQIKGRVQPGQQVVVRGNERLSPGQPVVVGSAVEAAERPPVGAQGPNPGLTEPGQASP